MVTAPDKSTDEMAAAFERAVNAAGSRKALADKLGVSQPAISQWRRVPAGRVIQIEALTGVSRHELRPDVFGPAPVMEGASS